MGVDETGRKMWDAYGEGWEAVGTGTAKITQSTKHLTTKKNPPTLSDTRHLPKEHSTTSICQDWQWW